MNACPHCGEPLTPDTPATILDELAIREAELLTLSERLRVTVPERIDAIADVELAQEHLHDAFAVLARYADRETIRLHGANEPEGGAVDPRPSGSCRRVQAEVISLRERVRVLAQAASERPSRSRPSAARGASARPEPGPLPEGF